MPMKKWSILSILLLVIISLNGQSQLRAPNYKVVPVSPNAASLGSFGNIPVDRYVGKSSLSIPIFDLELDGKKFPISLFYHTDGTRVAQESSWVGLGWTLQCGGCIIRQMQGSDDFKQGGCYENTDAPWLEDPTFTINNQNASLYEAYFSGEYDTQPDLFYFNAGGYSGTLYFDALKNQRDNLAVPTILSEEQVVRMEYDILADIWTMTDVEGFVYSFSTPETTTPFLLRTTDLSRQPPSKEKFLYSQGEAVITAWMLDSIVSPLGGKIIFEYEQDQIYTPIQVNEDAVMLAHVYGGQMNNVSPSYTFRDVNYSYSYSVITQCRLSKIAYEGGTVEFLTSDREDIESKIAGRKVQKLSTIQVRNNNGQVVKTTNLKYRYLLSNAASTNKGTEDRLLLEMVYDSFGNTRNHLYSFQYNPGILPAKDSYSVDAWGFYNEATPLSHPNWLKLSPTIYEPETYAGIPDSRIFMLGMDRSFREDLCRIGTLRQVTYPTGGTTTFEYEAHRFDELPMMPPLRTQYLTSVDNSTECENPVANYCYLSSDIRISAQFPRVRVSFTHEEPHPSENIPFDITYSVYLEKKQGNEYVLSSTLCRDIKLKDPWPQAVETKLEEGTYRLRLVVTPYEFEYPITINANLHGVGMIIEEKDYLGAGLRLKAMTHTDGNGHSIRKYYEYSGARLMVKPCFNGTARVLQSGNYADNWLDAIYQLIQSAPYVPLTNLLRGNLVGYSTIDEITANVADNGLVRYMYLNIPDKMPEAYLAGVPSLPDHRSGKLIAVHHLDGFNHLLRSETYTYNIRGWLTGISGVGFTQHLCYTDGPGIPCYNGNISSMRWQAGKESTIRGYRFLYDKDNRLMTAAYGEGSSLSSNMGRFAEQVTEYDMNGNILGLMRYGAISSNRFGMLDHLTYTLKGNQLQRVDDAVATLPEKESFEFADRVKQPEEYMYDANGNLTKDLNKDISQIQYNFLNLPRKAVFGDGDSIIYVYAADGSKLRRVTAKGRNTGTRDYCSNLIYENDVPTWLLTESGYITLSDGKYHYYLQDHQGNNRVVVNEFGKVEEVNHYYPFGGIFASTASVQPYKYSGKELEKSLWEYDYGARRYDAVLARWLTLDPSAEKYLMYSPYLYCKNNPILRIDLDGKDDYIVDSKGILFCKRVNQSAVDYVYYNKIGNDKRIFITDKNLLPSMKKNQTIAKNGYSAFGSTNNLGDAVRLF